MKRSFSSQLVAAQARNKGCISGWEKVGDARFTAPLMIDIIHSANSHTASTTQELLLFCSALKNDHAYCSDIVIIHNAFSAMQGYDFTRRLGSPIGYRGK